MSSSTLVKRTIPFCLISKTRSTSCLLSTTPFYLPPTYKNPTFPQFPVIRRPHIISAHARLCSSYPSRNPPEFSPPVPGSDRFSTTVPPEVPGISTSPEVDVLKITPPEVVPYPPPTDPNPSPDFPVPPLTPPPAPDVPTPFPDNPIPGPDILPPQPPEIVPPPAGPEIITSFQFKRICVTIVPQFCLRLEFVLAHHELDVAYMPYAICPETEYH